MRLRSHRRPVPEAVCAVPGRRLAWGLTLDGLALVASVDALHLGPGEALPWTEVEKAVWQPPALTVTEVSEVEGSGRTRTFVLAEDDHLAEVVRARVTSSVGWSDRHRLEPTGQVRLVGRRLPDQDALQWQLVFGQAADAADPAKRAQAEQMVASLRRTIG